MSLLLVTARRQSGLVLTTWGCHLSRGTIAASSSLSSVVLVQQLVVLPTHHDRHDLLILEIVLAYLLDLNDLVIDSSFTVLAPSSHVAVTPESVAFSASADLECVFIPSLLLLTQQHCLPGFAHLKGSLRMLRVSMSVLDSKQQPPITIDRQKQNLYAHLSPDQWYGLHVSFHFLHALKRMHQRRLENDRIDGLVPANSVRRLLRLSAK